MDTVHVRVQPISVNCQPMRQKSGNPCCETTREPSALANAPCVTPAIANDWSVYSRVSRL